MIPIKLSSLLWLIFVLGFSLGLSTGMVYPDCRLWLSQLIDHASNPQIVYVPQPKPM